VGPELSVLGPPPETSERQQAPVTIHAYLIDVRSRVSIMDWKMEYMPSEMRYAPVALAGVVASALHLPPLVGAASVNAAARRDYLMGLSEVRHDNGIDAALASLGRALAADSDSPLIYAALAEAQWFKYCLTDDESWLNRAKESMQQAEERNPDLPPVHRIAGLLMPHSGSFSQAIAEYLRAIELDSLNGDSHRRLGEAYEHENKLNEARTEFQKAIEIDPKQYRNYRDLGNFYYERAKYEEAIKFFRKEVELAPDEPLTHYDLALTYSNLGQFACAENELRYSIRLREFPKSLHSLGVC
jgi:tetratricopeptide (TPR) repeat protein